MNKEIPIACCPNVFTKEQRMDYKKIWDQLVKSRLGITEIEQGYEYEFHGGSDTLRLLNEWVSLERKCCPFLTFTVRASHEEHPIYLQLTGNKEVKSFLRHEIGESIEKIQSVEPALQSIAPDGI